jgi:hypothetical protein
MPLVAYKCLNRAVSGLAQMRFRACTASVQALAPSKEKVLKKEKTTY